MKKNGQKSEKVFGLFMNVIEIFWLEKKCIMDIKRKDEGTIIKNPELILMRS